MIWAFIIWIAAPFSNRPGIGYEEDTPLGPP